MYFLIFKHKKCFSFFICGLSTTCLQFLQLFIFYYSLVENKLFKCLLQSVDVARVAAAFTTHRSYTIVIRRKMIDEN